MAEKAYVKEIPRGDRISLSPKAPTEDSGPSEQREGPKEAAAARPHQQKGQGDPAGDPIPIIPEQLFQNQGKHNQHCKSKNGSQTLEVRSVLSASDTRAV